jgi:hypothetical protein
VNDVHLALADLLRTRLRTVGIDWNSIFQHASEVVVFGSRAVGVNTALSDLDVVVIGGHERVKTSGLDLVCVPRSVVPTPQWLSSELAAHVAKYGVWITGEGEWRHRASAGLEAVSKKERRLVALLANVSRSWGRLDPTFQKKYQTTIRRELQRLLRLREGIPVPPTPVLDLEWNDRVSRASPLAEEDHLLPLSTATAVFLKTIVLSTQAPDSRARRESRDRPARRVTYESQG